jgi:hypothetical protein
MPKTSRFPHHSADNQKIHQKGYQFSKYLKSGNDVHILKAISGKDRAV